MASNRERRDRAVRAYGDRVVVCPDCEVLCFGTPARTGGVDLWDIPDAEVADWLIPAVGLMRVLAHGVGVTRARHRCPPTWAPLTEVDVPVLIYFNRRT